MGEVVKLSDLNEGFSLPGIHRLVTQEDINLYAAASGDYNPIHIDAEFARKTPAGGTIAHGMLILSYISQMMTGCFERSWLTGGGLNVRFRTPARPGDTITVSGVVKKMEQSESGTLIYCDVLCANQNGETVINGEVKVSIDKQ
jgi:acyl dehydratase